MLENKNVQEEAGLEKNESALVVEKAKGFWARFSKPITYGALGVILIAGGYLAYDKWYKAPRETKAADSIWHAQQYFELDSIKLALNGDGQFPGFEKIAKNYSGTKAGNLAGFYAGVCHLKLNDFNKAVSYLKDFSTEAKEIQALAYSRLADAYSELNKNEEAISFYAKAGRHFPEQENISAENLFRAGLKSEILGKNTEAISYYKEVQDKYSRSERGYQVAKYLARLGVYE